MARPDDVPREVKSDLEGGLDQLGGKSLGNSAEITAKSAICVSASRHSALHDDVLWAKDADLKMLPASLAKLLTCLVFLKWMPVLSDVLRVESEDATGGSGNNLRAGDAITVEGALHNLMLPSSNVTAAVVARVVGQKILDNEAGSGHPKERFVQEMNTTAARLKMHNSHFINPHGLPAAHQYATARDLARLGRAALDSDVLVTIWNKARYTLHVGGPDARVEPITTSVVAIREKDRAVTGGKTGTLTGWGFNLLLEHAAPGGHRVITVVLKSTSDSRRYSDATTILNSVSRAFTWPAIKPV
ncbi:D-alanyl-D-alanine carboxypeptidase family protein [Vreelandella sp. TE19]